MKLIKLLYNTYKAQQEKVGNRYSINAMPFEFLKNRLYKDKNIDEAINMLPANNGISISKDDLVDFMLDLIQQDPNGKTYLQHPSDYPIEYEDTSLGDYSNNPYFSIRKSPEDNSLRPQCKSCKEMAYFGLPFCPHCMKPIPALQSLKDDNKLSPILFADNTIPTLSSASINTVYQDDDILISEKDLAAAKAALHKFVPRG